MSATSSLVPSARKAGTSDEMPFPSHVPGASLPCPCSRPSATCLFPHRMDMLCSLASPTWRSHFSLLRVGIWEPAPGPALLSWCRGGVALGVGGPTGWTRLSSASTACGVGGVGGVDTV